MIAVVCRGFVVLVLLGSTANAEAWRTRGALQNDAFTDLTPPLDDTGFTHDNAFSLLRDDGDLTVGGGLMHRWITSKRDRRRWDQLDLIAIGERRFPYRLTASARFGPTFGGNFGGRWMQNGWHTISGTGPTIDEGLANDYPASRSVGVLAGAAGRISFGTAPTDGVGTIVDGDRRGAARGVEGYARLDGQLSYGGVTSMEVAAGGIASTRHVGASFELALTRYHAGNALLALPGGYATGFQLEWRAGVHVAWSRFRISYQYRANEGGSGEPIGVIAVESRR